MHNPLAIVRSLLEAEEPAAFDPKQFMLQAAENPLPLPGVPEPRAYFAIESKLKGKFRNKTQRKVGNNTWLESYGDYETGYIGLRFHRTTIIRFYHDRCVVDCAGWRSLTTRARLDDYLPCGWKVYSHQGSWYWMNRTTSVGDDWGRMSHWRYPYDDGDVIVYESGQLQPQSLPEPTRVRLSTIRKRMDRERFWKERMAAEYPQYYGQAAQRELPAPPFAEPPPPQEEP